MLQPEDLGAVEEEEPFAVYTGEGASSSERVDVRQYLDVRLFSYLRPGWFGLTFDSIRPIYEPQFVSAEAADLDDKAYVLGLALNGDARGYPIGILARREMVNDVVGGVPVLVTW